MHYVIVSLKGAPIRPDGLPPVGALVARLTIRVGATTNVSAAFSVPGGSHPIASRLFRPRA